MTDNALEIGLLDDEYFAPYRKLVFDSVQNMRQVIVDYLDDLSTVLVDEGEVRLAEEVEKSINDPQVLTMVIHAVVDEYFSREM